MRQSLVRSFFCSTIGAALRGTWARLGATAGLALCGACSSANATSSRSATDTGGTAGSTSVSNGGVAGSASGGTVVVSSGGARAGESGATSPGGSVSAGGKSQSGGASSAGGNAGAGGTNGSGGAGGMANGNGGASGSIGAKLVPAQGALLGEYYGDGTVAATDMRIGRKPAVHLTYFAWDDDWTRVAKSDIAQGKIPLVNWEPDGIDFHDITSGKLDATINARASGAKELGAPFFLDFAAEMNGDEGWGGHDAQLYVSAYRHIHDLLVAGGATNAVWAWCPNVTDVDGTNDHTLDYYPGDAYVDWTCVDGYNWGQGGGFAWQSFHDVFADIYPVLAGKNKPILVGEMASDENGGDKGAWIGAIVPALKKDFPLIRGVVWFDVKKERSWQIASSPGSLAAYRQYAADPFMNP